MKKVFVILFASALLITGCGSKEVSQRYDELSSKYEYYQTSVSNIQKIMDVDATQADDIFLILSECGISSEINIITPNSDGTFAVWSSGDKYTVFLDNGVVSTVFSGKDELYPESKKHNFLMDYELEIKDLLNGDGETVAGQYAYIYVSETHFDSITPEFLKEFADSVVKNSGYNWVSIVTTSKRGICFSGSSTLFASCGTVDEKGIVIEQTGSWELTPDKTYLYSDI